ncbi:23S rRNA (uracil(1939)-C(5))-methyltransferase RlmD [soil metagenome]
MKRVLEAPEIADVVSMTHDGRGVARVDAKPVVIDGALQGESVAFVRTRRRRGHDEARLDRVLVDSPQRVTPRCAYFGTCGGCSMQHVAPSSQLEIKERVLLENLERIGGLRPLRVLDPVAGPSWGYRRRARLGVRYVEKKGRVLVGFRERNKPWIADMRACEVLAAPFGALIEPLSALIGGLSLRSRIPQIELAAGDDCAAMVLRVLAEPSAADLENLRRFEARHRVDCYLQPGGTDSGRPLHGKGAPLSYRIPRFDLNFEFQPTDFVQINREVNRGLVDLVVDLLAPGADDRVLDLFCGLGNFTLPLARSAASVIGVDGDANLVDRARHNAARNGIGNAQFLQADLFAAPDAAVREASDLMLLDPPRTGAAAVVGAGLQARRIVYVSCHPATLARDAAAITQGGAYELTAAGIVDMFPHTSHIECVAVLDAK